MPITLSDLQKDERSCTVEYAGESCKVTYRPSGFTPNAETEMQEDVTAGKASQAVVGLLSKILVEWDVLDEEGQPLLTDRITMGELPNAFLVAVLTAIGNDMQVGQEDLKNSGGGSLRKASKGSARGGIR